MFKLEIVIITFLQIIADLFIVGKRRRLLLLPVLSWQIGVDERSKRRIPGQIYIGALQVIPQKMLPLACSELHWKTTPSVDLAPIEWKMQTFHAKRMGQLITSPQNRLLFMRNIREPWTKWINGSIVTPLEYCWKNSSFSFNLTNVGTFHLTNEQRSQIYACLVIKKCRTLENKIITFLVSSLDRVKIKITFAAQKVSPSFNFCNFQNKIAIVLAER